MWHPVRVLRNYVEGFDADELRRLAVSMTDGIVATAGIVQGLNAADQNDSVLGIAALGALVAGGIGAGGAMYYESCWERDALEAALAEERREHAEAPEQELAELTDIYVRRGLTPELAREVAEQLSAHDPVAVHAREELGLDEDELVIHPVWLGITAGLAFALGALVPLITILLAPAHLHAPVTFLAVMGALVITSVIVARSGRASVWRTVLRTLLIGAGAMVLTMVGGELLD